MMIFMIKQYLGHMKTHQPINMSQILHIVRQMKWGGAAHFFSQNNFTFSLQLFNPFCAKLHVMSYAGFLPPIRSSKYSIHQKNLFFTSSSLCIHFTTIKLWRGEKITSRSPETFYEETSLYFSLLVLSL